MLRYTKAQKEMFSSSYLELANLGFAALIFGQFLNQRFSWVMTIAGAIIYFVLHALSFRLTKVNE